MNTKIKHGQFFTAKNPFNLTLFREWFEKIPKNSKFLEPFGGSNNLIKMMNDEFGELDWASFDIEPPKENNFPKIEVFKRDTLLNMPNGFDAIVTNPPYLAKNSATRKGIAWDENNKYDDLYKFCIEKCLKNCKFVAAIIPESFITSELFQDRLFGIISLTQTMFNDTECPVCIALWVDEKTDDFAIWQMDKFLGKYSDLKKFRADIFQKQKKQKVIFNDKNGAIGLKGVDGTKEANIRFVRGDEIAPEKIKHTSRALTRISFEREIPSEKIDEIINNANEILTKYRNETNDIFMTAFKGLRKDKKYRRRLDFRTAEMILNSVINQD